MQIKKITGKNYLEALDRVKSELGEDALILGTRTLRRSESLKAVSPQVEITAATDRFPSNPQEFPSEKLFPEEQSSFVETVDEEPELKSLVMTLLNQTERVRAFGIRERQFGLYKNLIDAGVNERLAGKMIERLNAESESSLETPSLFKEKAEMAKLMKRLTPCDPGFKKPKSGPRLVAFVGPTGAGKTTTLAKLAARFSLEKNKKVAIISLDTYRVGAVEQLRVYGQIMNAPVEVASDPDEFQQAVARHRDKDLILIDTTGKNHKDPAYPNRLKQIFSRVEELETHLVLSVAMDEKIFDSVYNSYRSLGIDRLLFTKLDEGVSFGPMFNFALKTHVPLSYFTDGQRVPEDIEVAESERVIRLIFNWNEAKLKAEAIYD